MESEASSSKVLPQGYVFVDAELFLSGKANEILDDLLKKSKNRNPDAFDMYVYNDYHSYAIHNLIESTFTTIRSRVIKKDWVEAFHALEALTMFFQFESTWTSMDDGELTEKANKLYGALLLSILTGLKDTDQLNTKTLPTLETVLRLACEFGEEMNDLSCRTKYATTCKAIANKMFKDTTADDQVLYEARLREFAEGVEDTKEKERILEGIEEYLDEEKKGKPWYLKGKIGSDQITNKGGLTKAWNDYKGMAPSVPLRGPPEWDLTKWTDEQKKPFLFSNMNDDEDFF